MLYALYQGAKVAAVKGERIQGARCPGCDAAVIAKCGSVKAWHWAHAASADCDPWHEGETRWHLEWKAKFPQECVEVSMGAHRADVRLNPWVIEFQNSSISCEEIQEREVFYGKMLWVFNAQKWHVLLRRKTEPDSYRTFRFKWPHWSLRAVTAPTFWDLGEESGMLHVKKVHWNIPTGGWGYLYTHEEFMDRWSERLASFLKAS
jgi:competence protein CoiA